MYLSRGIGSYHIRCQANSAPWITPEFLSLIDHREYWARKCRQNPSEQNFELKKAAQRTVQRMKNQLKSAYVQTCVDHFGNDPKKLWRSIRCFWPSNKSKSSNINTINGITGDGPIASLLNEHFYNVGRNVQSRITGDATLMNFHFLQKRPSLNSNM